MTPAERQRLYRRRKAGLVSPDATQKEIQAMLRIHFRPGPQRAVPEWTEHQRKRFKQLTGMSITEYARKHVL